MSPFRHNLTSRSGGMFFCRNGEMFPKWGSITIPTIRSQCRNGDMSEWREDPHACCLFGVPETPQNKDRLSKYSYQSKTIWLACVFFSSLALFPYLLPSDQMYPRICATGPAINWEQLCNNVLRPTAYKHFKCLPCTLNSLCL